jgi:hypothetical protein
MGANLTQAADLGRNTGRAEQPIIDRSRIPGTTGTDTAITERIEADALSEGGPARADPDIRPAIVRSVSEDA